MVADVAEPAVKAGEVKIRVKAFGLNKAESYYRSGNYGTFVPDQALGIEAVGEIVEDSTGSFLDVTEAKRRLALMAESEQNFRSLIENLPHYLSMNDRDGRIIFVNKVDTNTTREEILLKPVFDYYPHAEHALLAERLRLVFEERQTVSFQSQITLNEQQAYLSNNIWPETRNGLVRASLRLAI